MTLHDQIKALMDEADYDLTDDEYHAAYDWINANKDGLSWTLKEAMLKLINGEMRRRMGRE